jgi:hypothetical protein
MLLQQLDLSAAMLAPIRRLSVSAPSPSQVDLRRVRRAATRRCGSSRGSPPDRVQSAERRPLRPCLTRPQLRQACLAAAAGRRADAAGSRKRVRSVVLRGSADAPRARDIHKQRKIMRCDCRAHWPSCAIDRRGNTRYTTCREYISNTGTR